jgi:Concanavalin A-like lectin/glucanases superfamily
MPLRDILVHSGVNARNSANWTLAGAVAAVIATVALPSVSHAAQAPRCVEPPSDMVSWWPGDKNSDDIQGGNVGVLVDEIPADTDAFFASPGKVGDAFTFDGTGETYVRVPNIPANGNLEVQTVTIDAWVKAAASPGESRAIAAKGAQNCDAASYALYTANNTFAPGNAGGLQFYVWNGVSGAFSPSVGPAAIWNGEWRHVAGSFDGTTVRLFVDGLEIGTGTSATGFTIDYGLSTTDDFGIGEYLGTCSLPFKGQIDEVEVFNRALASTEIAAIHAAGPSGKCNVEIDVVPGSDRNLIHLGFGGIVPVPVAIYGSDNINVNDIDRASLKLEGAGVVKIGTGAKSYLLCSAYDLDRDGHSDLFCFFATAKLGLPVSATYAGLTGKLKNGTQIRGADDVKLVK